MPEVGAEGQARLLDAKALFIGAGGLGSPAMLYLAAAGVGTIGIVDFDVVDLSNLQRQVIHTSDMVGQKKVESARRAINALNPEVRVVGHEEMLVAGNVERIIGGYDVIVDGTDTFETRYLLNDAAIAAGIPVVHASVFRFEGQLTVFKPYQGPCYRCLYPTPPPPELAPGCSVAGVLGVVPGIMGLLQANEAIKLILGIGDSLAGRLLLFDALDASFTELKLRRDPGCPVCSEAAVEARAAGRPLAVAGVGEGGTFALGGPGLGGGLGSTGGRRECRPDPAGPSPQRRRAEAGRGRRVDRRRAPRGARRAHPGLRGQLFTPDGELNRFVNVYLNDQDVRYLQERATPVDPRDALIILPAMAGGADGVGGPGGPAGQWAGGSSHQGS